MDKIIMGCIKKDRRQQSALFYLYYNYGIAVAVAYCSDIDEAREVLNDSFLKVFNNINDYDPSKPFEAWFRIIIIRTAINHYRKHSKDVQWSPIEDHVTVLEIRDSCDEEIIDMTPEEVLKLVQQLPPAYRMAINLYAVEGYSHQEIAKNLGISVGTSKSNLSKARAKLKFLISQCKLLSF
ncbi:MAG: RNA polymerase sigma factor [Saprospiraceae bacterium]|nr:RNA polymerase sigma factor [Saprospiraceae bacterium]